MAARSKKTSGKSTPRGTSQPARRRTSQERRRDREAVERSSHAIGAALGSLGGGYALLGLKGRAKARAIEEAAKLRRSEAAKRGAATRAHNKALRELGRRRRVIFGYETSGGEPTGFPERYQLHGKDHDARHTLAEMIRDNDPRWEDYLDAADELAIDHDEAADGWFSPNAE